MTLSYIERPAISENHCGYVISSRVPQCPIHDSRSSPEKVPVQQVGLQLKKCHRGLVVNDLLLVVRS